MALLKPKVGLKCRNLCPAEAADVKHVINRGLPRQMERGIAAWRQRLCVRVLFRGEAGIPLPADTDELKEVRILPTHLFVRLYADV